MRVRLFLFGLLIAGHASGLPFTIRITTDNHYSVFTGTAAGAFTQHPTASGSWPVVRTPPTITPPITHDHLYVLARDDGSTFQGLLATVAVGTGYATTGSPLWTVCATNALPNVATTTPAMLTARIVLCNNSSAWRATSNGPNDGNASLSPNFLWGNVAQIDDAAAWIWDNNPSAPCTGPAPSFLRGPCNPGESLIFRISLQNVAQCPPPVPDFTMNWTAGYGMLVADGSNSQNELNYFWSIQESDPSWNTIGPEIMQWFPGQAGPFDLKAFFENGGQRLKCDTYYRVKLAVANRCVSWRDTIKLIRPKCCPGDVILPTPQP